MNKNFPELAVFVSMLRETPSLLNKLLKMSQISFFCSSSLFCEINFLALSKHWTRKEYYLRWKRFCVSHIIRWRCRFHFRYVTNNILLTLRVYFARRNFFLQICGYFLWVWASEANSLAVFSSELGDFKKN